MLIPDVMQLLPGWRSKFPAGQAELEGDHGTDTPGVPWGPWEREKLQGLPWDGNEIREFLGHLHTQPQLGGSLQILEHPHSPSNPFSAI